MFIATANTADSIPSPLLDRMELINLSGYITDEKLEIAKRHLIPKLLPKHGLKKSNISFTAPAIREIANSYAREAGVRAMEKSIKTIMRKAAMDIAEGIQPETEKVVISPDNLEKYLGKPRFTDDELMKQPEVGVAMGLAWTALGGATLLHARLALFERLRRHLRTIYAQVGGGEELDCTYESTLGTGLFALGRDDLRDLFLDRLEECRDDELRRGVTLVGPQRDDIAFTIGGRDARTFGSQGQQRSVVLAWKMAEVEIAREVLGEQPLLLLDDVMSELDEHRRAAMTRFVQGGIQTVVTTTNLAYFPHELLESAEVIRFGA